MKIVIDIPDENYQMILTKLMLDFKGCEITEFPKGCEIEALEEIPQGEWIHLQAIGDYKCSICGCENLYKYANEHERWVKTNSNFCPNCGADMGY